MTNKVDQYYLQLLVETKQDAATRALAANMKQITHAYRDAKAGAKGTGMATRGMRNEFNASSKSARYMGYQIQNASYQVADFFVMVQGGIAPLRAVSQQLPQLLAGFGVLGAAAGAVAAIGASVILTMKQQSGELKTLTQRTEDAADATSDYVNQMVEFQRTIDPTTQTIIDMKRELADIKNRELLNALAPPDGNALMTFWTSFANVMKTVGGGIRDAARDAGNFFIGLDPNIAEAIAQLEARDAGRRDALDPFRGRAESLQRRFVNLPDVSTLAGSRGDSLRLIYVEAQRLALAAQKQLGEIPDSVQAVFNSISAAYDPLKRIADDYDAQIERIERERSPMMAYTRDIEQYADALDRNLVTRRGAWLLMDEAAKRYEETLTKIVPLQEQLLKSFTQSFDAFVNGVAQGTAEIKDLFKNMVQALVAQLIKLTAYYGIFRLLGGTGTPLGMAFGNAAGIIANAKGNVISGGRVQAFASGGVVNGPTVFPMARGFGLMGEAGAEAIMPLRRMANGELGVGGQGLVVNVNNSVSDLAQVGVSQNEDGVNIEVVRAVVASDIAQGGSLISRAIGGSYGVARSGS